MDIKEQLKKEREKILRLAFSKKLLTKEEYEKEYKSRYIDCYGCDSFLCYLSYVVLVNDKEGIFITLNDKIIKDRKKIEKRFGIRILSVEEAEKIIEDE